MEILQEPQDLLIERETVCDERGSRCFNIRRSRECISKRNSIYAEVLSYGTTNDAYNMVQPLPDGEQGRRAIQIALDNAGIKPNDVDYINAHGSSTPLNERIETKVIKEVFGEYAYKIPISSIKSMIGHALGAAGAIEAIASVLTIKHQYMPPTINYEIQDPDCDLDYIPNRGRNAFVNIVLTNSCGFGGKNSAIVLRKFPVES
jgi:3-oxoacyl-[acyl-carrier-protein] synthase II